MPSATTWSAPLPVAPGSGPFRAKGLAYRGVMRELCDAHGEQTVLERCEDPALREFLAQPFLAASWYDIFPIIPFSLLAAQLEGTTPVDYCHQSAQRQAREDLSGVYRSLLSVMSPQIAVRAIIKVTHRYFDFGKAEIVEMEGKRCLVRRTGVPEYIFDWYSIIGAAYIEAVIEAAGGRDIQVEAARGERGSDRGHPIATQDFTIRWA